MGNGLPLLLLLVLVFLSSCTANYSFTSPPPSGANSIAATAPSRGTPQTLTGATQAHSLSISFSDLLKATGFSEEEGPDLEFRVTTVMEGILRKSGEVVTPGQTTIHLNESLSWRTNNSGTLSAFKVEVSNNTHVQPISEATVTIQVAKISPINGTMVAGGQVASFSPAKNSQTIVFRADKEVDEKFELYAVKKDGTSLVKLSGNLPAGGDVVAFTIAPDSSRVAYVADQDTDGINELYSVKLDGTGRIKLNPPLVANGNTSTSGLRITEDSTRVTYLADQEVDNRVELYIARLDGSAAVLKLSNCPWSVGFTRLSLDSNLASYRGRCDSATVTELYVTKLDASGITKVSGPLVAGGNVDIFHFFPDSQTLFFQSDKEVNDMMEAYTVKIDGTGMTKISPALPAVGDVINSAVFDSPSQSSGEWAAFRMDGTTDGVFDLVMAKMDGSQFSRVNPVLPLGRNTGASFTVIDGSLGRVMFRMDETTQGTFEIYVANQDGSGLRKLNSPLVSGGNVLDYPKYVRGRDRGVYLADEDADEVFELYSTSLTSSDVYKLNPALPSGGDVQQTTYQVTEDGNTCVYIADGVTDAKDELFAVGL